MRPMVWVLAVAMLTPPVAVAQDVGTVPAEPRPVVPEAELGADKPFDFSKVAQASTETLVTFAGIMRGARTPDAREKLSAVRAELTRRGIGDEGTPLSPAPTTTVPTRVEEPRAAPSPEASSLVPSVAPGPVPGASPKVDPPPGPGTNWHGASLANLTSFWATAEKGEPGKGGQWIYDPMTGKPVLLTEHVERVGVVYSAEDELANTQSGMGGMRRLDQK